MYWLNETYEFPPVALANPDGILALGGDLHPNRLIRAYRQGVFPWYNEGEPIIWYCPDPRMVLKPSEVYVSKSMRKIVQSDVFQITYNQNFEAVIQHCQSIKRKGQKGTWITHDLKEAMVQLHKLGFAKSVEVWRKNELVGGLYGVDLGTVFTGESMFSLVPNASKVAFIALCQKLETAQYQVLDCQMYNEHLARLGAYEIPREVFLEYLK